MKSRYLVLLLAAVALPSAVRAQSSSPEVISDPAMIRSCLCRQQSVAALSQQLEQQKHDYETRRAALTTLNERVASERQHLDPNNPAQVDAFKQLLDQQSDAELSFADETTPAYAAVVKRHNEAAVDYNRECASKDYNGAVLAQVQAQSYSCPKP